MELAFDMSLAVREFALEQEWLKAGKIADA